MLRRLLVAVPAAFLFALFAASVVSAHEGHDHSLLTADAGQELRGRVVETHGDTMTGEAKGRTFWLETGGERIRLVGAPDSLRPGERVRVRGTRQGGSFVVAADAGAVTADGPAAVASVGPAVTKNVAVIAFTFSDNTSQPWTTDQIRANFFATSNSVRSYFSDASYGQVTVTGNVFGWYQIAANDDACNTSTWATQAKAAATAAGVNLNAYQHIAYVFPRSAACGWAGLAYMPGKESWNNGTLTVRVAGHELAHNFGVHHASTLACTSAGARVTLSTSCTESEYGDPFDIMGSAARLTNNWHRWRLGYFTSSEVLTVTSANAGQLALGVVSHANSVPKIVRVARGDGNFYYLEFRQPFGSFDNFAAGDSAVNGVLMRVAPDQSNVRPLLLDGNPATATFIDAAFGAGQTFTDSARGISISVVSVSTSGAVVNVSFGGGPSPTPTPTPAPSPTPTPTPDPSPTPTPTPTPNPTPTPDPSPTPPPPTDTTPPTAPGDLTATVKSETVIVLAWSAATDDTGVTGYRIARNGNQVATTANLSWTNMVLKPATTYTYTVTAVDAAGNTGPAVEVSATTKADKVRPGKPPRSRIVAVGSRQTKLTWGAATDNVAVRGYRLYIDGAYYKTITGRVAYIRTSRGYHSFSVRTVDTSANRSYQIGATIRVR